MTHYTVFDSTTGKDISVGTSEPTLKAGQSFRATAYDPSRHADRTKRYVWNVETRDYDEADSRRGVLSPAQFVQRFTAAEHAAIKAAAAQSADLAFFLYVLERAQQVDLDDPPVVNGLADLVAAQLLTAERAEEIRAWV